VVELWLTIIRILLLSSLLFPEWHDENIITEIHNNIKVLTICFFIKALLSPLSFTKNQVDNGNLEKQKSQFAASFGSLYICLSRRARESLLFEMLIKYKSCFYSQTSHHSKANTIHKAEFLIVCREHTCHSCFVKRLINPFNS